MTYAEWRDRLAAANDPELYPVAWQDHLVLSGEGHFWASDKAAIVTQFVAYPSGVKACLVYAGAGDMAEIMDVLTPRIEAWARLNGCTHGIIEGRDGWRRQYPAWRHHKTILIKDLVDG